MTVRVIADHAAQTLISAGFAPADARRDVSVLARHVLGWTMADWVTNAGAQPPAGFAGALDAAVRRRMIHEPVAYITGGREFYGRQFMVTPAVLIPRPETEELIDEGRAAIQGREDSAALVLDVGTGSGCIAVTIALEHPSARVIASDTSRPALAVARENARRLGADWVEFIESSLVPPGLPPLDLLLTNPPYVPERDRGSLSPDVRDFEPAAALFGGQDGLDVIRELVPRAAAALKPGGRLVMEIGIGQADRVTAFVEQAGLQLVKVRPDLQGIPRVVVAERV